MSMDDDPIFVAAVEGGGTTFCVAVAHVTSKQHKILHREEVDSSQDPDSTLEGCIRFFQQHKPDGGYHALGVASFGPVGLNATRKNEYGCILSTSPKESWRGVNLLKPLVKTCGGSRPLSVKIETDVNAPALAEYSEIRQENSVDLTSLAYVTVGTGVGVGLVINGECVHGRMHPEGGHVAVQPLEGDTFEGYSWGSKSPYGGKRTVEGIASSVALTERLEQGGSSSMSRSVLKDLPDNHFVWDHAANAIANLCVTLLLTTSIERIVLGGGILKRNGLLEKIQERTVQLLNGYLELPQDMSQLITTSTWGDDAGLVGAIALARRAYEKDRQREVDEPGTRSGNGSFHSGFFHGVVVGCILTAAAIVFSTRRSTAKP